MALISIMGLGVAEAYEILSQRLGHTDLPPLDAIENEDWGRDLLLSRFESLPEETLAGVGLIRDPGWDRPERFVNELNHPRGEPHPTRRVVRRRRRSNGTATQVRSEREVRVED